MNQASVNTTINTPLPTRRLDGADVSASAQLIDALASLIVAHKTLYDWASDQRQPRALRGRAPVFVATIPDTTLNVVVRHAWHGGLFAPITRDFFRFPSRAPHEFTMSQALVAAGIPTTVVVGYARYDAWFGLCRVDVVSAFVPDAYDLGMVIAGLVPDISCDEAMAATRTLLKQLAVAGVHHPDLNVKNILLTRAADQTISALVIDVDVIRWNRQRSEHDTMRANVARLGRSIRKWRRHFGCDVTERMLMAFERDALTVTVPPPTRTPAT